VKYEDEKDDNLQIATKNRNVVKQVGGQQEVDEVMHQWEQQMILNGEQQAEYEETMKEQLGIDEFSSDFLKHSRAGHLKMTPTLMLPLYCEYDTKEKCRANKLKQMQDEMKYPGDLGFPHEVSQSPSRCNKLHFIPSYQSQTVSSQGD
jgi:hypothetical protein